MLPDFFSNLKMENSMPSRYHFTWNIMKCGVLHTLKKNVCTLQSASNYNLKYFHLLWKINIIILVFLRKLHFCELFKIYSQSYKSFHLTTGYTYTHPYQLFCFAIPDFYREEAYAFLWTRLCLIVWSLLIENWYIHLITIKYLQDFVPFIIYNSVLYIKEPVIFIWRKLSTILQ